MKKSIFVIGLGLLLPLMSFGQLGNLLKGKSKGEPKKEVAVTELDYKQHPLPPTILMSSFLNKFDLDPVGQVPFPGLLKIVFLPTKDVNGGAVDYAKEHQILGQVKQLDKIFATFYFEPINKSIPVATIGRSDVKRPELHEKALDPGNYTFEISMDKKVIFAASFEVTLIKNEDIYSSVKEYRLMDGYWSKYGYFEEQTSDGTYIWNFFLTSKDKKIVERIGERKSAETEHTLFYEGKPWSKVVKASYGTNRGEWEATSIIFFDLTPKSNPLNKTTMKDGNYTIKSKVNGEEIEYTFKVKDSQFVLIDEQDPTKTTDPTKIFEGMKKEFWVKRSK